MVVKRGHGIAFSLIELEYFAFAKFVTFAELLFVESLEIVIFSTWGPILVNNLVVLVFSLLIHFL